MEASVIICSKAVPVKNAMKQENGERHLESNFSMLEILNGCQKTKKTLKGVSVVVGMILIFGDNASINIFDSQ